jgi:hypothetical protein
MADSTEKKVLIDVVVNCFQKFVSLQSQTVYRKIY